MAEAAGTIRGDVQLIREAIYGREVRAAIAEALELLQTDKGTQEALDSVQAALQTVSASLQTLQEAYQNNIGPAGHISYTGVYQDEVGGIPSGKYYMHYADGSSSKENLPASGSTYVYVNGRRYQMDTDGSCTIVTNSNENAHGDRLCCGYKDTGANAVVLYDPDGNVISNSEDGYRHQNGVVYAGEGSYGIVGFVHSGGGMVTLESILSRIAALEKKAGEA